MTSATGRRSRLLDKWGALQNPTPSSCDPATPASDLVISHGAPKKCEEARVRDAYATDCTFIVAYDTVR